MIVPGIFLIGGTFKSPELNTFPKLELLKTLLSFSRPWAPTSISVKQQFATANLTSSLSELKLRGLSPHANYTDRAAAAGWRS